MESTSQQIWKPTTAGILNLVTGALSVMETIGIIIALVAFDIVATSFYIIPAQELELVLPLVNTILIGALILSILHAIFPIIGGIYALKRRRWGWALAGSIIAIIAIFPFGIASTILVAIAKEEFE